MSRQSMQRLFRRFASPACVVFGILCGLIYATVVYIPGVSNYAARTFLVLMTVSAGPMALSYLWGKNIRSRYIPFLWEMLSFFFILWTLFGISYGWLTFTETYVPEKFDFDAAVVSFVVGTIAGTVWIMAALLLAGTRLNVAIWDVERFPLWIQTFVTWLSRKITRKPRRKLQGTGRDE